MKRSVSRDAIIQMPIHALKHSMKTRDLALEEVYDAYQDHIARCNPVINAYTQTSSQEMSPDVHEGPLSGIPVAIKDIFDVLGYETTAGSSFFRRMPKQDAFAVSLLRQQGCVVLGKTNTHEFAMGGTTINPHFGTTKNPWDLNRVAGGSSGGSAAAIAAGLSLIALGSDTAGSIRIPAAFCGVVGLKPTYDQIPCHGVVPLSWSLDHVGFLTRSVVDMRETWAAVFPDKNTVPKLPPLMRIGVILDHLDTDLEPAIEAAMTFVLDQMSSWNVEMIQIAFPLWHDSLASAFVISRVEAATYHQQWLESHADKYGDDVRILLDVGRQFMGTDYVQSQRLRAEVITAYQRLFETVDFVITPTVSVLPPLINNPPDRSVLTQLTAPANLAGVPAISVPIWNDSSLPIGLQIMAPWGQESALLTFAQQIEDHISAPRLSSCCLT